MTKAPPGGEALGRYQPLQQQQPPVFFVTTSMGSPQQITWHVSHPQAFVTSSSTPQSLHTSLSPALTGSISSPFPASGCSRARRKRPMRRTLNEYNYFPDAHGKEKVPAGGPLHQHRLTRLEEGGQAAASA